MILNRTIFDGLYVANIGDRVAVAQRGVNGFELIIQHNDTTTELGTYSLPTCEEELILYCKRHKIKTKF